jgi:Cof subfamily protein (haloacid dehalogenase superfamily)
MKARNGRMAAIRILATDLDGTIVLPDYTMTERTLAAIAAFKASGRGVVISTGRPRRSALPWARRLGGVMAMVCQNGAAIYDCASSPEGELCAETTLPEALSRRVVELSRRLGLHFHGFTGDSWFYEARRAGTAIYEGRAGFPGELVDFDELPALKFNKLMFVSVPDREFEEATAAARELCGDEASLFHSSPGFLEIVPKGVSKAAGLEAWLRPMGLSLDQVMAMGDAENDREIVLASGIGVAMGDAPEDMRAGASYVAGTVGEDGAAEAIERFLAETGKL